LASGHLSDPRPGDRDRGDRGNRAQGEGAPDHAPTAAAQPRSVAEARLHGRRPGRIRAYRLVGRLERRAGAGQGTEGRVVLYLDTHVLVWLYSGEVGELSAAA